jgi:hydrogenase nickel incorporation protein HypB
VFREQGLFVINLLSSPGSGKTALLEQTIAHLAGDPALGVVEGDVQTDRDAQRIAAHGIPVVQIVTRGGCHLEAKLVQDAVSSLELGKLRLLVIENVGNLVCPASYDLGENRKVVMSSTTEGDDKPLKYPKMFRVSNACIINKVDLLPHVDFDVQQFKANARQINPALTFFETSARTGQGIDSWIDWLRQNAES